MSSFDQSFRSLPFSHFRQVSWTSPRRTLFAQHFEDNRRVGSSYCVNAAGQSVFRSLNNYKVRCEIIDSPFAAETFTRPADTRFLYKNLPANPCNSEFNKSIRENRSIYNEKNDSPYFKYERKWCWVGNQSSAGPTVIVHFFVVHHSLCQSNHVIQNSMFISTSISLI